MQIIFEIVHLQAIDAGVKALKSGSVSDEDVARGKAQLKAESYYFTEKVSGLAYLIGNQAKNGDGQVLSLKALIDAIDSVSTADCRAVSLVYIKFETMRPIAFFSVSGTEKGSQLQTFDRCRW
jgi:predicted Zn-dependent peptidase